MGTSCCKEEFKDNDLDIPEEPLKQQTRTHTHSCCKYRSQVRTQVSEQRILEIHSLVDLTSYDSEMDQKKKKRKSKSKLHAPGFKVSRTQFLDPNDEPNFLSSDDNLENNEVKSIKHIDLRFKRECILSVGLYRKSQDSF